MFSTEIGKTLQKYRTNRGITQTEMAKICQTRQGYISAIEKGKHIPSAEMIKKYAETLNVSADILLSTNIDNYVIPSLVEALSKLSLPEQNKVYALIRKW